MSQQSGVLVVGLGITGSSVIEHLAKSVQILATDTRLEHDPRIKKQAAKLEKKHANLKVISPRVLSQHWCSLETAFISPGIPLDHPIVRAAKSNGLAIQSDLDLFLQNLTCPTIAITGTNGKSTVVALTAALLESSGYVAAGNIGVPVLEYQDRKPSGVVLELSSFQLERMSRFGFNVAACLNISQDHLDHHTSFAEYLEAKHRVYQSCELAIYNADDPLTIPRLSTTSIAINRNDQWCVRNDGVVLKGRFIPESEISLKGTHNRYNVVVAAACALHMGLALEDILPVLQNFRGLPHRLEEVESRHGITCINDSKSTNVASTIAALNVLSEKSRPRVLMIGGDSKMLNLTPLESEVQAHADHVILYGKDACLFKKALGSSVPITHADSFEEATLSAISIAKPEGTVLLSPACASFDMFENYMARGLKFREIVRGA